MDTSLYLVFLLLVVGLIYLLAGSMLAFMNRLHQT